MSDFEWTVVNNTKNKMYKTKFCNKEFCNKKKCNFAHTEEELRTIECKYKKTCRQVYYVDNEVHNKSKLNICNFIHPEESKKSFLERINKQKNNFHIVIDTNKKNIHEDINNILEKGITCFYVNIEN